MKRIVFASLTMVLIAVTPTDAAPFVLTIEGTLQQQSVGSFAPGDPFVLNGQPVQGFAPEVPEDPFNLNGKTLRIVLTGNASTPDITETQNFESFAQYESSAQVSILDVDSGGDLSVSGVRGPLRVSNWLNILDEVSFSPANFTLPFPSGNAEFVVSGDFSFSFPSPNFFPGTEIFTLPEFDTSGVTLGTPTFNVDYDPDFQNDLLVYGLVNPTVTSTVQSAPIPEPSTACILLGLGSMAGVALRRRRRLVADDAGQSS